MHDVSIVDKTSGDFLKYNGTLWVNDQINLGTDTTGIYVADLVAGTGVIISNGSSESASPSISIGQAVATSSSVTFAHVSAPITGNVTGNVLGNVTGDLTGNASTASTLQTSRAISLSGDVSGSVSFNGSSDVTITATVQPNSVALGTDTTGDYVASLVAGNNITLSNNSGEGATPTINSGMTISDTIPSSPTNGQVWYESDTGKTFVYYDSFWVEIVGSVGGVSAASTSAAGVVQLTDSTSSTSTTTAATPNSVKSAFDIGNAAVPKSGGTMTGDLSTTGLVVSDTDGTGVVRLVAQTSPPSAPAAGSSIIYTETVAGRPFLEYRGPIGDARNLIQVPTDRLWAIHSNSGTIGCGTNATSGTGTRTIFNNIIPRFTTAATVTTSYILWMLNPRWLATLGFYGFLRIGFPDASYDNTGASTGSRIWGLCAASNQSHPTGPRGVVSGARRAFGFNREHVNGSNTDTNWQVVSNHSDPVTVVDTGMPFVATKIYDQYLYRAPGDTNLYWRIDNYTDSTTASGVIAVGAASATSLAVQPAIHTIDAVARAYDIYYLYIEQERT
jgi:hypothetical protein